MLKIYQGMGSNVQIVRHLTLIYKKLAQKNVPHTDKLHHCSEMWKPVEWPYIQTYPLGDDREPQNRAEVLEAVNCVLEALLVSWARFLKHGTWFDLL